MRAVAGGIGGHGRILGIERVAHGIELRIHAAVAQRILVERIELPVAGVDDRDADAAALDAGRVQVARVHVDRERVAFAEVGGVGDLDVVDVDVVLAERTAHAADEADRRIAAAVVGDVVRLAD